MSEVTTDYDSAWKQTLKVFFPDFMAFFFPDAHGDVEWAKGYQFLDKELQQAASDAELGRRYADVLAQVWRQGGEEAWVLVHVEVQGQPQAEFAERMYVYNYRLYDYHQRRVIDLFRFIDWVLHLPKPQELAFWHDVRKIEEEKGMPYVTSVERIGIEQGLQQGLQQGRQEGQAEMVLRVLSRRLGAVPSDMALRIRGLPDPQLPSLMDVVVTATTLPEVTAAVEALSASAGDESSS